MIHIVLPLARLVLFSASPFFFFFFFFFVPFVTPILRRCVSTAWTTWPFKVDTFRIVQRHKRHVNNHESETVYPLSPPLSPPEKSGKTTQQKKKEKRKNEQPGVLRLNYTLAMAKLTGWEFQEGGEKERERERDTPFHGFFSLRASR